MKHPIRKPRPTKYESLIPKYIVSKDSYKELKEFGYDMRFFEVNENLTDDGFRESNFYKLRHEY